MHHQVLFICFHEFMILVSICFYEFVITVFRCKPWLWSIIRSSNASMKLWFRSSYTSVNLSINVTHEWGACTSDLLIPLWNCDLGLHNVLMITVFRCKPWMEASSGLHTLLWNHDEGLHVLLWNFDRTVSQVSLESLEWEHCQVFVCFCEIVI